MLQKSRVIVLSKTKYNDTSVIVHTYSENQGRLSLWLRIPKSKKSRVKSGLFQPLSILEVDIDTSSKSNMGYIKEAKSAVVLQSIPFHPVKASIALFLAEFLSKVLMEESENRVLFSYLITSIEWLDKCERTSANFHLVFLMRLTLFLGLSPNLENYHDGDWFDLRNGIYVPLPPFHKQYIRPEDASRIRVLVRMNYENMHLFSFSRIERGQILDVLLMYYSIHVNSSLELKSLSVLKELFI